jgi:hypothetical protein
MKKTFVSFVASSATWILGFEIDKKYLDYFWRSKRANFFFDEFFELQT